MLIAFRVELILKKRKPIQNKGKIRLCLIRKIDYKNYHKKGKSHWN